MSDATTVEPNPGTGTPAPPAGPKETSSGKPRRKGLLSTVANQDYLGVAIATPR